MASISGEQSCGSAVNVTALVGVSLESCTRGFNTNNITVKFKVYMYGTGSWSSNSWCVWVDGTKYTVFNSNTGANHTEKNKKYYTPTITLTLSCSGTSTSFKVGVNGNAWNPSSAHTSFTFKLTSVPVVKYKIIYNANGGTWTGPEYTTKNKGTDVKLSTTKPTKTGFTFNGWGLSASDTSKDYSAGGTYTKDEGDTLYAIWTENYVKIQYYSNYASSYDGTETPLNTVSESKNVLLAEAKYYYNNSYSSGLYNYTGGSTVGMYKTGYTKTKQWGTTTSGGTLIGQDTSLTGQSLAEKLGNSLKADGSSFTDKLYAQWTPIDYTVTTNSNGGYRVSDNKTGNTTSTYNYKETGTIKKRARTGYTLTGYKLTATSDGSTNVCGAKVTLNSDGTASYTHGYCDITATAQWKINTYTITYKPNGGKFSSSFATTQSKNYGATATIKTFSGTPPAGSNFLEWNTEPDGTGTSYANGASYSTNKALTLYAIYDLKTYAITYNANGGTFNSTFNSKNPQSKTHGVNATIYSFAGTVKSGNTFAGWNTAKAGTGTAYAAGATYKTNANLTLYAQWATSFGDVGAPSSLTITDNGDNTVKLSCKVGANGTNNKASGVEIVASIDNTTPKASVFTHHLDVNGSAGATVSATIPLYDFPNAVMYTFFGSDAIGPVKFKARTLGAVGGDYHSDWTSVVSGNVTFHTKMWEPKIISPRKSGAITGTANTYKFEWGAPNTGVMVNNSIAGYNYRVYDETSGTNVAIGTTTNLYYILPANKLTAGHTYRLYVQTLSSLASMHSIEAESGPLVAKNISAFSAITPTISNASSAPTTMVYGEKVYMSTGHGNVLKVTWPDAVASNNEVSHYSVKVTAGGAVVTSAHLTRDTEYFITADDLSEINTDQIVDVTVTVTAASKYGSVYNSPATQTALVKCATHCSGIYTNISEEAEFPIMKRAIAFVKVPDSKNGGYCWRIASDSFAKDNQDDWHLSDTQYEVLLDQSGDVITDENGDPIYIY